jgi:predicted ATPase
MSPGEIARRLGERFRLLAVSRGSIERRRTLLGALSWSHDLLGEPERVVFRRLAVFPASFDLAGADAVAVRPTAHWMWSTPCCIWSIAPWSSSTP